MIFTFQFPYLPLFPSLSLILQSAPNLNNKRRRSLVWDSDVFYKYKKLGRMKKRLNGKRDDLGSNDINR